MLAPAALAPLRPGSTCFLTLDLSNLMFNKVLNVEIISFSSINFHPKLRHTILKGWLVKTVELQKDPPRRIFQKYNYFQGIFLGGGGGIFIAPQYLQVNCLMMYTGTH